MAAFRTSQRMFVPCMVSMVVGIILFLRNVMIVVPKATYKSIPVQTKLTTPTASSGSTTASHAPFSNEFQICRHWLGKDDDDDDNDGDNIARTYPSLSFIWKRFGPYIKNVTYGNQAKNPAFTAWVDALWDFYTLNRLRQSTSHSPNGEVLLELLKVLSKHVLLEHDKNGNNATAAAAAAAADPLRIFVTAGTGARNNPVGLPEPPKWKTEARESAWPALLDRLWRDAIWGGGLGWRHQNRPVVQVVSLASGGSDSSIGSTLLQYRAFPQPSQLPDIVINAFSANDQAASSTIGEESLANFIHGAATLRPCENRLPLVILLEDFVGWEANRRGLDYSGKLYETEAWFQVMGVTMNPLLRTVLMDATRGSSHRDPLLGGAVSLHNGMGYHIGVAWTVLFNLLRALVDTCHDVAAGLRQVDNSIWSLEFLPAAPLVASNVKRAKNDTPSLHSKDLSFLKPPPLDTVTQVVSDWENNKAERAALCTAERRQRTEGQYGHLLCTYYWMVSRTLGVSRPGHLEQVLRPILKHNRGWKAQGQEIRQPRTGWYVNDLKLNATFTIEIPARISTNFLTVISMKSYSLEWKDSLLSVNITVQKKNPYFATTTTNQTFAAGVDDRAAAAAAAAAAAGDQISNFSSSSSNGNNSILHFISGYHSDRTSVHYSHKLAFPPGGAQAGDNITVTCTMVHSGAAFKIHAMFFCRD